MYTFFLSLQNWGIRVWNIEFAVRQCLVDFMEILPPPFSFFRIFVTREGKGKRGRICSEMNVIYGF